MKQTNKDTVFIWVIVLSAIGLFHSSVTLKSFFHIPLFTLPLIESFHYGEYIAQKSFLLVFALGIILYYALRLKTLGQQIRENAIPIIIIAATFLLAHFLSFNRWFYSEDYRVLSDRFTTGQQLCCGGIGYYSLMPILLVARWFGARFELYNGLGLLIYFLVGVVIFCFLNLLQKNKTISLLAALFFVTSSGYYLEMTMMTEFIGDGISLLLFILSLFLLVGRFYAGAVIFAAAALEFGLSRSYFIALPLFITGLLFTISSKKIQFSQIVTFIAFPVLSLFYLPVLTFATQSVRTTTYWEDFIRLSTMFFGVSVPHEFTYLLIQILQLFMGKSIYVAPVLGILLIGLITLLMLLSYKKNVMAAKLLLVGMVIVIGSIFIPSTRNTIRLALDLNNLTSQFADSVPTNYTAYGIFSVFGASLLIAGIALFFQSKRTKIALLIVIILNIFTSIWIETQAIERFAKPQKEMNQQLMHLLPVDGKQKLIFVPENPKDRTVYGGISHFYEIYYPMEPVIETDNPETFIQLVNKYSVSPSQMYLFVRAIYSNKIYDFSYKLRAISKDNLSDSLKSLTEEAEEFSYQN